MHVYAATCQTQRPMLYTHSRSCYREWMSWTPQGFRTGTLSQDSLWLSTAWVLFCCFFFYGASLALSRVLPKGIPRAAALILIGVSWLANHIMAQALTLLLGTAVFGSPNILGIPMALVWFCSNREKALHSIGRWIGAFGVVIYWVGLSGSLYDSFRFTLEVNTSSNYAFGIATLSSVLTLFYWWVNWSAYKLLRKGRIQHLEKREGSKTPTSPSMADSSPIKPQLDAAQSPQIETPSAATAQPPLAQGLALRIAEFFACTALPIVPIGIFGQAKAQYIGWACAGYPLLLLALFSLVSVLRNSPGPYVNLRTPVGRVWLICWLISSAFICLPASGDAFSHSSYMNSKELWFALLAASGLTVFLRSVLRVFSWTARKLRGA